MFIKNRYQKHNWRLWTTRTNKNHTKANARHSCRHKQDHHPTENGKYVFSTINKFVFICILLIILCLLIQQGIVYMVCNHWLIMIRNSTEEKHTWLYKKIPPFFYSLCQQQYPRFRAWSTGNATIYSHETVQKRSILNHKRNSSLIQ